MTTIDTKGFQAKVAAYRDEITKRIQDIKTNNPDITLSEEEIGDIHTELVCLQELNPAIANISLLDHLKSSELHVGIRLYSAYKLPTRKTHYGFYEVQKNPNLKRKWKKIDKQIRITERTPGNPVGKYMVVNITEPGIYKIVYNCEYKILYFDGNDLYTVNKEEIALINSGLTNDEIKRALLDRMPASQRFFHLNKQFCHFANERNDIFRYKGM